MAAPSTGIIIVNWNAADDTIACLESLRAMADAACRWYVVDNASTDDSVQRIRRAQSRAVLLQAATNRGYAAAFNLGCRQATLDGMDYLWLLNNDTAVAPDTLAVLLAAAQRHGPAIYSPLILHDGPGETIWYAGGRLDWRLKSDHVVPLRDDAMADDLPRPVAWATGCSLFCSVDVVRRIGPMDERYFLYLEDVDWCLRGCALGIPTMFVPQARIVHGVSRSVRHLDPYLLRYYSWRNYYLLLTEHGRWWQRLYGYADLASRFAKIAARLAFFPAYRQDRLYRGRTQALCDFSRGRFGVCEPWPAVAAVEPLQEAAS